LNYLFADSVDSKSENACIGDTSGYGSLDISEATSERSSHKDHHDAVKADAIENVTSLDVQNRDEESTRVVEGIEPFNSTDDVAVPMTIEAVEQTEVRNPNEDLEDEASKKIYENYMDRLLTTLQATLDQVERQIEEKMDHNDELETYDDSYVEDEGQATYSYAHEMSLQEFHN
jgi:hypothetical protein